MEEFWKGAAAVLLASVLGLVLDRQQKDISVLVTIGACLMAGAMALSYLEPVVEFLKELDRAGELPGAYLELLLKAVGVGLTAELAGLICADAGKASLGKALQTLGSAAILYLTMPMLRAMFTMIQKILGGI